MRIRKRPTLQSLCSPFLTSDPPNDSEPPAAAAATEMDPPDPPCVQLLVQAADASPSSRPRTLDSQITSDDKSEWCNKGKKPAIMEGSRCSRVNGRGWRCCQQTLVGYSLCEHHLGKGRLRSIGSGGKKLKIDGTRKHNSTGDEKKIGTSSVKARSISSLLDETDHAAAAIISSLANNTATN